MLETQFQHSQKLNLQVSLISSQKNIKIFQDKAASDLLKNPEFLKAWDENFQNCPWATIFQAKDFVATWYSIFEEYKKIIVTDWDGKNLSGLITLTIDQKSNIVAAGTDQAEYQAWISLPHKNDDFITEAIKNIRDHFPSHQIIFRYLPPKTPLTAFKTDGFLGGRHFLIPKPQPLLGINKERLEKELGKKVRKEKTKRLKRLGCLNFHVIHSFQDFNDMMDYLTIQSDFRKGAKYNKLAFLEEPKRKKFLLELYKLGLLHVSILKSNDEVIASNVGVIGDQVIHLQGMNSHSPYYSKYSPGILHFLMLGMAMEKEKFRFFDLTPGGSGGFKDILANTHQDAHMLIIDSQWSIKKEKFRDNLKQTIKKNLIKKGFPLSVINNVYFHLHIFKNRLSYHFKTNRTPSYTDGLNKWREKKGKNQLKFQLNSFFSNPSKFLIRENKVGDLLLFMEKNQSFTRWEFLNDSFKRMELGQRLFTLVENKKLRTVLWYIPAGLIKNNNDPENQAILCYSFYQDSSMENLIDFAVDVMKKTGLAQSSETIFYLNVDKNQTKLWRKCHELNAGKEELGQRVSLTGFDRAFNEK